jgi:ankyrin repeat protein
VSAAPISDEERWMIDAVDADNAQQVTALLDAHPSLDIIDRRDTMDRLRGRSHREDLLYRAAGGGHEQIVEIFLQRIPRSVSEERIGTAAGIAVERGYTNILRSFLNAGLNPDSQEIIDAECWRKAADSVMKDASSENGPTTTAVISNLHSNCSRFAEDTIGVSLLHKAAYYGHWQVSLELLFRGAEPCIKDSDARTPIDYALERGHTEVAESISSYIDDGCS